MRDKILGANAHAIVMSYVPSAFENHDDLLDRVRAVQGVTGATPFIYTEVMLSARGGVKGVVLRGIDPRSASSVLSMALKPRGIFSWLTGTGVLKDEYLERDTNAIAAFGLNEGYVDIQVAAPTVEYHDDGIYITFNVHEGPRYTVRNVVFAGDVIDSEDKMLEVVKMDEWKDSNKYFSLTVMGRPDH